MYAITHTKPNVQFKLCGKSLIFFKIWASFDNVFKAIFKSVLSSLIISAAFSPIIYAWAHV